MTVMWIVATLILTVGFVDDLRSRKVHNSVVLFLLSTVIATSIYCRGWDGSITGLTAFGVALLMTIPLFAFGILGGGDVKLFAIFSLALDPLSAVWTFVYSILWGALFGVVHAALHNQLPTLVRNTLKSASMRHRLQRQEVQKIPYTFAYLLGWFTQITFLRMAGAL